MIVYEPVLKEESFFASKVMRNLDEFKKLSDVVVANRITDDIEDFESKLIKYNDGEIELAVSFEKETIWLSQLQISELFGTVATKDLS